MIYTYCTDSYKPQSGEIGAVINLFKSGMFSTIHAGSTNNPYISLVFAFNIGFYALPFGEKVWFDASFATLAAINAVLLIPLVYLVFRGEKIREKQDVPKEHQDL